MKPYTEIDKCRICGNTRLETVLNLGTMAMSGIFPSSPDVDVPSGPLELVRCVGGCGLVQLKQTYNLTDMYGDNYGYRSGLNASMVKHLKEKAGELSAFVGLKAGDMVIDIGSNDGTLLGAYLTKGLHRVGVDPTANKFRKFYDEGIDIIPDFFSAAEMRRRFTARSQAKLITSISMFYDLEDPTQFMAEVEKCLTNDGVWHCEQSYLPSMLERNAYDTICHEHLEYYSLKQIEWMADRVGLKLVDARLNSVNGGSIAISLVKVSNMNYRPSAMLSFLREAEAKMGLDTAEPYKAFSNRVLERITDLVVCLSLRSDSTILGYGASTKGNILLQACSMNTNDLKAIVEVNPDKFGCYTPGTKIPIISEAEGEALKPDYILVLPWHFREGIIKREKKFLDRGGKLIFPLPNLEIVGN